MPRVNVRERPGRSDLRTALTSAKRRAAESEKSIRVRLNLFFLPKSSISVRNSSKNNAFFAVFAAFGTFDRRVVPFASLRPQAQREHRSQVRDRDQSSSPRLATAPQARRSPKGPKRDRKSYFFSKFDASSCSRLDPSVEARRKLTFFHDFILRAYLQSPVALLQF